MKYWMENCLDLLFDCGFAKEKFGIMSCACTSRAEIISFTYCHSDLCGEITVMEKGEGTAANYFRMSVFSTNFSPNYGITDRADKIMIFGENLRSYLKSHLMVCQTIWYH